MTQQFTRELIAACKRAIASIPDKFQGETVYGVALYTTEDFCGFDLAFNTEESLTRRQAEHSQMNEKLLSLLKDHPDLLATAESYNEPVLSPAAAGDVDTPVRAPSATEKSLAYR